MKRGIVYLIGAGPGDPGLLTLRGAELLAAADVVVYDHLANPLLLEHCQNARRIYVGKQSSAHTLTQDGINQLLVKEAQGGNSVARLKGGDPFVFGRGGEECEVLHEAGIPFEIVPGITAAIAASAYAGIPVTHRDFNNTFTLVTGHEKEGADSELDWPTLAHLPCLAFYMGIKSLDKICTRLIENGKPPTTPVAIIQWGTTPRQRTAIGTLADIVARVAAAGITAPAMTLIGQVVQMRNKLNWFETRPLFGQTILVTRTRRQAGELSVKLAGQGANVIECPTLELSPPNDWTGVDNALRSAAHFDWIIFTSVNGVEFTKNRLFEIGLDCRAFGKAKIAAVGAATAAALTESGLRVDLCPAKAMAESLADELIQKNEASGKRFLLLRADIARPVLVEKLTAARAAEIRDVAVYESRPPASLPEDTLQALEQNKINWITFASGGTARNFTRLLGPDYRQRLAKLNIASIGPITSGELRELGLEPTIQSTTASIDALVAAIADHARHKKKTEG